MGDNLALERVYGVGNCLFCGSFPSCLGCEEDDHDCVHLRTACELYIHFIY